MGLRFDNPMITTCPICKKEVKAGFSAFPMGLRIYHDVKETGQTHIWYSLDKRIFITEKEALEYLHNTYPHRFTSDWVKYMLSRGD